MTHNCTKCVEGETPPRQGSKPVSHLLSPASDHALGCGGWPRDNAKKHLAKTQNIRKKEKKKGLRQAVGRDFVRGERDSKAHEGRRRAPVAPRDGEAKPGEERERDEEDLDHTPRRLRIPFDATNTLRRVLFSRRPS